MLLILHFFLKIFDGVFCASLAHFSTNICTQEFGAKN